ncbi:MAG: nuclear transport factor 2 family protein [Caldilineaceae bacterium]
MEPALVVQGQLDAYNAKDIEQFMTYWAEDAAYYAHPNQLLAKGANAIRTRHILRFQEPKLFGKLEYRDVIGNIVIDHELVTRTFPEGTGTVKVVCTYEVIDDKITQAWFLVGVPILDQSSS